MALPVSAANTGCLSNGTAAQSSHSISDLNLAALQGQGQNSLQAQRTLYVGNLNPQAASESFLMALFSNYGNIVTVKILHEPGNDPYGFVEFAGT
jgi:RNA recognition motif-containing protein